MTRNELHDMIQNELVSNHIPHVEIKIMDVFRDESVTGEVYGYKYHALKVVVTLTDPEMKMIESALTRIYNIVMGCMPVDRVCEIELE